MPKRRKEKFPKRGEIIIYKAAGGKARLEVKLENETVWLDAHKMGHLFGIDRSGIVKHIKNIYQTRELEEKSTCAKIAQVAKDGKVREMDIYNLDMIISVGYKVNSKEGTRFRIWATKVLKGHLLKGFTINEKRLKERDGKLEEMERAMSLLRNAIENRTLSGKEARGLLKVITDYANSWVLLQKYDERELRIKKKPAKETSAFTYEKALEAMTQLKADLIRKKEASDIFGREREHGLESILGNINQSFGGRALYPSIEEKAAHLLYFIIKDHPFVDGNKRVASFLFIIFLMRNRYLYNKKGEKKINDNALVALALLVAESNPKEKDIMIALITNLL